VLAAGDRTGARVEGQLMQAEKENSMLGVVGGLGPWASAEFLKTIYEDSLDGCEQDAPRVIMYSDPTFPDRTDAFLAGNSAPLLRQLTTTIERLLEAGATRVVLCCMTIHYLLPRLPPHLRERVVSLIDVVVTSLMQQRGKHLLLCSTGTRKLELFEQHPHWSQVAAHVVLPVADDQRTIHQHLIYPIKKNPQLETLYPLLESLLDKYEVDSFIVGCSEMHLLAKRFVADAGRQKKYGCLDPLAIIARELSRRNSALPP
jgi:aspartate racemase